MPARLSCSRWHKEAATIERGPLLYALRIGERWVDVEGRDGYGPYRECYPTDPWNYGLNAAALATKASLVDKLTPSD